MSIEVQTESTAAHANGSSPIAVPVLPARLALWKRRRYQVGALLVAAVLVGAMVGNNLLARQYSPDGAVRQYLSALQSGQADSAWSLMQVASANPSATSLLDKAAFKSSLANAPLDLRSFAITGTTAIDSNSVSVNFTYDTAEGSKHGTLLARRSGQNHLGIYPAWIVLAFPAALEIRQPAGTGGVSVDGKQLALGVGTSQVAVLPLAHKVQFVGTPMLESQTVSVDMFDGAKRTVNYQAKLTAPGTEKATAAVKTAFQNCAKQSGLRPAGCPQTFSSGAISSGQWVVLGDPTQGLAFSTDSDDNVVAGGHFLMKFGYQESGMDGTAWGVSGGDFQASLVPTSADITVSSIKLSSGLAGLDRPAAATDDAAKAAVSTGMSACKSVKSGNPGACPQGWPFPTATNFSWTLNGDPIAGASVSFDPNSGLLTVHGAFSMTATYYVSGYAYSHDSYTNGYNAYLYWDGQKLVLITIDGQ